MLSLPMSEMVPLDFQLAALILLSFSWPPRALIALSTVALASLASAARPGSVKPCRRAIANTALENLIMGLPRLVRNKGCGAGMRDCMRNLPGDERQVMGHHTAAA